MILTLGPELRRPSPGGPRPVLDAIPCTTELDQLQTLTQAIRTLAPELTPTLAQANLGPVLDVIPRTTGAYRLQALAQAIKMLGSALAGEQAEAALSPVLNAILTSTFSYTLEAFADVIQTLGPKLSPEPPDGAPGGGERPAAASWLSPTQQACGGAGCRVHRRDPGGG